MRILVTLASLMFFSIQTYACSCMSLDVKEAYKEYEVVFIGRVAQLSRKVSNSKYIFPNEVVKAKFEISKVYKGSIEDSFNLVTHSCSAICGFPFESGVEYAVFAHFDKYENEYAVNLCSPTVRTQVKNGYFDERNSRVMEFLNSM